MDITGQVAVLVGAFSSVYAQYQLNRNRIIGLQQRLSLQRAAILGRIWRKRRKSRSIPPIRRAWSYFNYLECFWEKEVPYWSEDKFQSVFRLRRDTFQMLCRDLGSRLGKRSTVMRNAITLEKRIAIALYFLKSGSDYGKVGMTFGCGKSTVYGIVHEFCDAIIDKYLSEYIKFPSTEEEMEEVVAGFWERWKFPGVLGAIDGFHIPIRTPSKNGEEYYNYNGWHSLIFLTVVNSKYRFIYTDAGYPGKISNSGVLFASSLWDKIKSDTIPQQYHLIGDDSFPLCQRLMKPFEGNVARVEENFNDRPGDKLHVPKNNHRELTILVNFMVDHREFACGQLEGPLGKISIVRQWEQLKEILDLHGPPKTLEQWKRAWKDLRMKVRAANSLLHMERTMTGNIQTLVTDTDRFGPEGPRDNRNADLNWSKSRLLLAGMVVEDAFMRLKGRWRVLLKPVDAEVSKIVKIINTCCVLHNICEEQQVPFLTEWLNAAEGFENSFPQPHDYSNGINYLDGLEKRKELLKQINTKE